MADKQKDIKSMIELIISNIDEFDYKFITYKADSMKQLLQNTLEYIEQKEEEREGLKKEKQDLIDKYNQISINFYNGDYCNIEHCSLLKFKEQELKNICKAFDIEYAIDEETGNLIGRCNKLYKKEQECENLKEKNQYLINTYCHFKNETKKYKKAVHKYKVVLQDKIERLHLSRREFLKEINSISKRIACNNEDFNNAIQVINNEDRYKQALDEIEKYLDAQQKYFDGEDYHNLLDIINKVKGETDEES